MNLAGHILYGPIGMAIFSPQALKLLGWEYKTAVGEFNRGDKSSGVWFVTSSLQGYEAMLISNKIERIALV